MNNLKKINSIISVVTAILFGFYLFSNPFKAEAVSLEGAKLTEFQTSKIYNKTVQSTDTNNKTKEKYRDSEFIIKFKGDAFSEKLKDEEIVKKEINKMTESLAVEALSVKDLGLKNLKLVKYKGNKNPEEVAKNLKANYSNNIEYIEPNYTAYASDVKTASVPSDPYYGYLWGMKNTGQYDGWQYGTPGIDINVEKAWDITKGSSNVVVAVIDSGVDYNHPDLVSNIWKNTGEISGNYIDDDGNGYIDDVNGWDFYNYDNNPMDDCGHGTHVSGTIAASANGIGVVGVAPNIKILPLKWLDSSNSGYIADAILAINYANKMGAKISNNSWYSVNYSQALYDAINNYNGLFVAAAANDGRDIDLYPRYPSSYNLSNILSVAAIDNKGALANFSNYGITSVDVAAPGVNVYSDTPYGSYQYANGTSMAAPHVAGVAALVLSGKPSATTANIKDSITNSVVKLNSLDGKIATGGIVNAYAAIDSSTISYQSHVQNIGWQSWVSNGSISGTSGQSLRLEAIRIKLGNMDGGVEYRTHVQNLGWMNWVSNGALSGTEGLSYRLEAINIRLTGAAEQKYDIYYRVHAQNFGWMDWAKNGASAGTAGFGYRLEAIQILLVPKGNPAPGATGRPFIEKNNVSYQSHVQNIGWQSWVSNGSISGTSGQSLRLEAIRIKLEKPDGGIEYRTHVQNLGWMNWVSNSALSGTEGLSYRLEAIDIRLTGAAEQIYDIYYRVHAQNFGWMGWAKNGASAGTAGFGYRLEAIQIVLVPKGNPAPGITSNSFIQK